jgi:deoxyribodipyrimidine photo-lyase
LDRFQAWCRGETENAFVNAGMKELRLTGFLSNRMRQVVASYLIDYLHLDWRLGAAWFEEQLIDYDVASNWGNWSYLAGVGSDPRGKRIFNPQMQANQYDPEGIFQKRWL